MGADLCSDVLYNSNSMFNQNQIKKQSLRENNKSHNIKENVSIYSNSDLEMNNNNKYFNNETDLNNLWSSIFDNDENDHVKKYEQEINSYDHPYIFNQNTNTNHYENTDNDLNNFNTDKEYTFKNSPSGEKFPSFKNSNKNSNKNSSKNSKKRIFDYKKSNELISSTKNSFKKFEGFRNKNNQKVEEICSFGNFNLNYIQLDSTKNQENSKR